MTTPLRYGGFEQLICRLSFRITDERISER